MIINGGIQKMIICDSHIHSEFSSDSSAPLDSIIQKAIQLGIPKICLTDHHDIDFPINPEDGFDFQLDFDSYFAAIDEIRHRYGDRIDVRSGVELGLMNTVAGKARDIADKYKNELDFIIGSSHLVRGLDPYYPAYYEGRTEIEGIRDYFESILENVTLIDDFDVYGHLDYAIRYAKEKDKNYSYEKYKNIIDRILETILSLGKGIEINTAGLRKGLRSTNPCFEIVKRYRELGGKIITVGSDAHVPEDIGSDFSCARQLLVEAGFTHYYIFKERMPYALPL